MREEGNPPTSSALCVLCELCGEILLSASPLRAREGPGVRSPHSPLVEMTHWVVPGSWASGWMVMTTAAELP